MGRRSRAGREAEGHRPADVGNVIVDVAYVTIDYPSLSGHDHLADGPHAITSSTDWTDPVWLIGGNHTIDFGIQFMTSDDRLFCLTWDRPGRRESLVFAEGSLVEVIGPGAGKAVWHMNDQTPWAAVVGQPIDGFSLDYEPWSVDDGFWCTSVTIASGPTSIRIELNDLDETGNIAPAADNLAIVVEPGTVTIRQRPSS